MLSSESSRGKQWELQIAEVCGAILIRYSLTLGSTARALPRHPEIPTRRDLGKPRGDLNRVGVRVSYPRNISITQSISSVSYPLIDC